MLCLSITFPEGEKHDGILLALSKGQMRIVLEGCPDAVELREVEGQWALENGTQVELDVLFTEGSTDIALFSDLYPRASVAGHAGEAGGIGSWSRYQPLPAASVH